MRDSQRLKTRSHGSTSIVTSERESETQHELPPPPHADTLGCPAGSVAALAPLQPCARPALPRAFTGADMLP